MNAACGALVNKPDGNARDSGQPPKAPKTPTRIDAAGYGCAPTTHANVSAITRLTWWTTCDGRSE